MDDRVDIGVQHRLLGAEDVNWDSSCENGTEDFVTPFGVTMPLSKINAGHIPLDKDTYLAMGGAKTVGAALAALAKNPVSGGSSSGGSSGMQGDTTVEITSEYSTVTQIQENLIDVKGKDLGGHVLTFQFAENLPKTISAPLVFDGFYNGKLVVDLNGNTLTMGNNIAGVLRFLNCQAVVEVTGGMTAGTTPQAKTGTISFGNFSAGVTAEESLVVTFTNIAFVNNQSSTSSYAVYSLGAEARFRNCTVTNGLYYKGGTQNGSNVWTDTSGSWIACFMQAQEVKNALLKIDQVRAGWRELFSDNYIVSCGTEDGVSWMEYNNGILIQWGSVAVTSMHQSVGSHSYYYYAERVNLAKKFSDTDYLTFANSSWQLDTSATFSSGNLSKVPDIYNANAGGALLIPSGGNNKKNNYFIIMDTKNRPSSQVVPSGYSFDWMAIGTIHDDDKTDVEDILEEQEA